MNRCNFSLISALYDSKKGGLYNDVYFPIVKYSLVTLYYEDTTKEYHNTDELCKCIENEFGLNIPLIVLRKTVKRLSNGKDFELEIYEDGEYFKINQTWDLSTNIRIDEKRSWFEEHLKELEEKYALYLDNERIEDKSTFVEFISANTDDLVGYFDKDGNEEKIGECYAFMAHFLYQLETTDKENYEVATQLFWGSVIAGFLKREDGHIKEVENDVTTEYFLDTSLIMGILDLSTETQHKYSTEMLDIIKSIGGIPRVHPITIKEVSNILKAVEAQGGPYHNTEIADAYVRRKLKPSALAIIRANLIQLLDKVGIFVFPSYSDIEIKKTINNYKNKQHVLGLGKYRNSIIPMPDDRICYQTDNFREIHDIYMFEYVRDHRTSNKNIYFVTLNSDYISFVKEAYTSYDEELLHPGKIVVEHWMHNSTSSIATNLLTETLTRCQILREKDLSRKLRIVSKYYNSNIAEYSPDAYKAIIIALYKKARNVVAYVDEAEENDKQHRTEESHELILKALNEAKGEALKYDSRNSDLQHQVENHEKAIQTYSQQIEEANIVNETLSATNDSLQQRINNQTKEIDIANKTLDKKDRQIDLLKQKDRLKNKFNEINRRLFTLNTQREKSVNYTNFYVSCIVGIVSLLIIIGAIFELCFDYLNIGLIGAIGGGVSGAIIFVINLVIANQKNLNPLIFKQKVHDEQVGYWDKQHPEYSELNSNKQKIETAIQKIDEELQNLDNII